MPKKSNLATGPEKREIHKITEADLAETRAKIVEAANNLENRLQTRIREIEDWKNITSSYPLEFLTGFFASGFVIGSGITGEIFRTIFMPAKGNGDKPRKRRSLPGRLFGIAVKTGGLVATPIAVKLLRGKLRQGKRKP